MNTDHIHSHIVWNSVSCVDGKKYRSNYKSYVTEIRTVSDELCRKYKLSVIDTENSHHVAKPYAEWLAEKNNHPTWRTAIQTKSVERVFRGERTTLKTAQEIAAALKCKPEKLFHIELDHRPIARKTIKEYAIFLRLVMQYAEREYGIDSDTQTLAVKGSRSRPVDCLHPEEVEALI